MKLICVIVVILPLALAQKLEDLGCWKDTSNRAIATLEGKDKRLDGAYRTRTDPITKCRDAALSRGFSVFAIQHGGWCASSIIAEDTYKKYGEADNCADDGEGGGWANQVYRIPNAPASDVQNLGCWADTGNRAIPTLEEKDNRLDGHYSSRKDSIKKCKEAALSRGFTIFAVQNGGWCASSADAQNSYQKYGRSNNCAGDGEGGGWANQVYRIKNVPAPGLENLGCWTDTRDRAIPTLERQDDILDGSYRLREEPIRKCKEAALSRGFNVFAIQNGGWCASSENAEDTFKKYGESDNCKDDGEGGPWANQVYKIPITDLLEDLGCWKDTSNRAISTLEGKDKRLDGSYRTRTDPITKCRDAALSRGFSVFAIQHGGWCASSIIAQDTYKKYGEADNCAYDGEGGGWANQVYRIPNAPAADFENLGCWADTANRAIPTLEEKDNRLDGHYPSRKDTIKKCKEAALSRGFTVFAVQDGGWCASSADAQNTYKKYGRSNNCAGDGEGGGWANQVYRIKNVPAPGLENLGCWTDTRKRAIPTLEGHDDILDGSYRLREEPIRKCKEAALSRGFNVFAIQNGGWCASSENAEDTFKKYGESDNCKDDGEGGKWANQVYRIPITDLLEGLGCWKDTSNRAIATLEGKDKRLDGSYRTRRDPITKCRDAALSRGFSVFAIQHGGWCASSIIAEDTYKKYGKADNCADDGEGGGWANQVYRIPNAPAPDLANLGCWADTANRAIPTLEEKDKRLDGHYPSRKDPIKKCKEAALSRGFTIFAVQNGGWCASSADAQNTYQKYGPSNNCASDGEGGGWANQVYRIKNVPAPGLENLGCWTDSRNRAIPTLERQDDILDGNYRSREEPIRKCKEAALSRGFSVFAIQNGGWCASSENAEDTFKKYGESDNCMDDGEGGKWANQVYKIAITDQLEDLGCWKDTSYRAIATLEGKDDRLDGSYRTRRDPITKCRDAALSRGFSVFAIQHGGWCASSIIAQDTYKKYGKADNCADDGEGGGWANQVYRIPNAPAADLENLGCWKDASDRAIPTLEGRDDRLDGSYTSRKDPITKCKEAALSRGYAIFAVQNGGWCASSADAENTYKKYGRSNNCAGDGEGGGWANQVYRVIDTSVQPTEAPIQSSSPTSEAPVTTTAAIEQTTVEDQTTDIPILPPCEYPVDLKNVAHGKPTYQTSNKPRQDGGSEKAVDGNKNSNLKAGNSCTWTDKEYQPRWEVDLGASYDIYEVVITNRQDCCSFRIKNAEIRVGDNENFEENPVCGMMINGKMSREGRIPIRCGCETPMRGRYVSIQLVDKEQMLHLCEVEVMAG